MLKYDGQTLYRETQFENKKGVVQRVKHRIQLATGQYYHEEDVVDGAVVRRKVISARGFEHIASIAGILFRKPDTVKDENGLSVDNPIIRRRGNSVDWVRIREVVIGRGENGNLRAIDLTLSYDVGAALSSSLMDFWIEKGCPAWGSLVADEHAEEEMKGKRMGRAGIGGGNSLLYSLTEPAIVRMLADHARNAVMADRAAATLVERNLMRRFLGFSEADDKGMVEFYSWPMKDIAWDEIRVAEDGVVVEGQKLDAEKAEEVESSPACEAKGRNLHSLIRDIAKEMGPKKAAEKAKSALLRHSVRWADIGAIFDEEVLLAIYQELKK